MRVLNYLDLAPGKILRVINDGGFLAGHGAEFKRFVGHGMAEVKIKGVIYWISIERLSV